MSETWLRVAAWLLTYALHSTVLLGVAALLTARWVRGEAWRETLWKAALLGGVVTASLHAAGWTAGDPGRRELFVLRSTSPAPSAPVTSTTRTESHGEAGEADGVGSIGSAETVVELDAAPSPSVVHAAGSARSESAAGTPSMKGGASSPRTPVGWALLAWAVGAVAMLARLAWRQAHLRHLLRDRAEIRDDALLAMLAKLRRDAGIWRPVRLTASAATPTPLALGGGEICVPPRFLRDLDPEQQRSALAHELAHLARRDPTWHLGVSILEAVFFFQPLNRLARARLRESAEFLSDAWAARQTGSPLGLARCLAEVASWVAPGRHPVPAGTMAMAEGGSPLVQRVQRLTARDGETREGSGIARAAVAVLLIGAVAAIAPAVASTDGPRNERTSALPDTPPPAAEEGWQEIVVIPHPDPAQPLSRRWAWAVDEIARRGMPRAWIAWTVPTGLNPGPTFIASAGLPRSTVNRRLGAPADDAVMLFTVARDGQLEHAVGHTSEVDLARYPVVWLGTARGDESFAALRRLADGLRDPDPRQRLVEAAGIHDVSGVVPYLAAVLGRDGSNGVRREAAFALGRHPSSEALTALRTAADRDSSDDVRREAVDALGRMGTAESSANLRELAFDGRDADVREGAVEALGQNPVPSGMGTLIKVALGGNDPFIAREAVEAMGRYPAEEAAPTLVRVAWTSDDRGVARQAAESLGQLPARWTVAALDSIARRHPSGVVAQQAVESLGQYAPEVVEGYLLRIARTHRDPGVREEAMDQLARRRADPDVSDAASGIDGGLETETGSGPESTNTSLTSSPRAPSSESGSTRRP